MGKYWQKIKTNNNGIIEKYEDSAGNMIEYDSLGRKKYEYKFEPYFSQIYNFYKNGVITKAIVKTLKDNNYFVTEYENNKLVFGFSNHGIYNITEDGEIREDKESFKW